MFQEKGIYLECCLLTFAQAYAYEWCSMYRRLRALKPKNRPAHSNQLQQLSICCLSSSLSQFPCSSILREPRSRASHLEHGPDSNTNQFNVYIAFVYIKMPQSIKCDSFCVLFQQMPKRRMWFDHYKQSTSGVASKERCSGAYGCLNMRHLHLSSAILN